MSRECGGFSRGFAGVVLVAGFRRAWFCERGCAGTGGSGVRARGVVVLLAEQWGRPAGRLLCRRGAGEMKLNMSQQCGFPTMNTNSVLGSAKQSGPSMS